MVSVPEFIEEARTRHEGRVGRREERRDRRHARRVRFGEIVTQEELDSGEAVLEEAEPSPEPEDEEEASEPWGTDKPLAGLRDRFARYQAFLAEWREAHPEDPTGDEPVEDESPEGDA
jgi:hypothetical protein